MQFLRSSTAVDVRIGPAVSSADGLTPIATLNLGTADQAEALKHNGAATVDISARTFAAITGCTGWYDLTLTTADTNTLGMLTLVVQDSSLMAPIFKDFMVIPVNAYDSFVANTDQMNVDVTQLNGDSTSLADLKDMVDVAYNPANNSIDANIVSLNNITEAAAQLADSADTIISSTVTGGTLGDLIFTIAFSASYTTDDALNGRTLMFSKDTTTAALRGVPRRISSYTASGGLITLDAPLPASVVSGDSFVVM